MGLLERPYRIGYEAEMQASAMTAGPTVRRSAGLVNLQTDIIGLTLSAAIGVLMPAISPDAALLGVFTVMLVWLVVNVAWNVVLGFAGILSFGQIAFFGVGAYTAAILSGHAGVSSWLDTLAGAVTGGIAALLIGLAVLRLRGIYVVLVTLAFHQLLDSLVSTDYSGLTGGPNGLAVAPYVASTSLLTQSLVGYWIALVAAIAIIAMVLLLLRSPIGLALVAARDAEHVATARGVMATKYRMVAFVLSGAVAGLMGAFYAHYIGVVSPELFSFGLVISLLSMIIVGGWGTVWGPIVGTVTMTILTRYVQGEFPEYQSLIMAAVLVLAVLLFPGGLVAGIRSGGRHLKSIWERME